MAARGWGRYSRSEGWHASYTGGSHDGNEAYNRYIRGWPEACMGTVYVLSRTGALLGAMFNCKHSLGLLCTCYLPVLGYLRYEDTRRFQAGSRLTLTTEKKRAPNSCTRPEGQTPPPREFCNAGPAFSPTCSCLRSPVPACSPRLFPLALPVRRFSVISFKTTASDLATRTGIAVSRLWRSSLK